MAQVVPNPCHASGLQVLDDFMDESQDRWRSVQADNSDAQVLLDAALTKYQVCHHAQWAVEQLVVAQRVRVTAGHQLMSCRPYLSNMSSSAGCKPLPLDQPRQ